MFDQSYSHLATTVCVKNMFNEKCYLDYTIIAALLYDVLKIAKS